MRSRLVALGIAVTCVLAGSVGSGPVAAGPAGDLTYDGLPIGAPTTLPWWQRGKLHLGDSVIETQLNDIGSRNGTTVVAADEYRRLGRPTQWFLVDGERLERLPMRAKADQPLISADGHWLAWLEVRAPRTDAYKRVERYRVVVYDVEAQQVANRFRDRRLVAWEDGINGIWLRTLSNDGRLVLSRGSDGVQVLSPRGRPVRFGGQHLGNGATVDGWPLGTTIVRPATDTNVFGLLSRDGGFEPQDEFIGSSSGQWSADGSAYAFTDYDTEPSTAWVRPVGGEPVQLAQPDDERFGYALIGWESADALIYWHYDDYSDHPESRQLRCLPSTGACEQVPGGPAAGRRATMPGRP